MKNEVFLNLSNSYAEELVKLGNYRAKSDAHLAMLERLIEQLDVTIKDIDSIVKDLNVDRNELDKM
jgi:hypothetical protein